MSDTGVRRARGGGGATRRAERTAVSFETAKFIQRNIPNFDILNVPRSFSDLFSGRPFRGAGQEFRIDLSPGTVRWHLHEARRTLRGALSRFFKGDV